MKKQIVLGLALSALLVSSGCAATTEPVAGPTAEAAAAVPAQTSSATETDAEAAAEVLARVVSDPVGVASADMKPMIDPRQVAPAGSTMTPRPETWRPDGLGGGTMTGLMTSPGMEDETFLVLMVKENSEWKVSATWPVDDGKASPPKIK
jgi:hypothetical protein